MLFTEIRAGRGPIRELLATFLPLRKAKRREVNSISTKIIATEVNE